MRPRIGVCGILVVSLAARAVAIPISIVDNLPGTYIDISSTGTLLTPTSDGSVTDSTSGIGNALFPAGALIVAENGGISFGTPASTSLAATNDPIPSVNAFGGSQAILGYWDDLIQPGGSFAALQTCPGKTGGIFRAVSGTTLVVQYRNVCVRSSQLSGPDPSQIDFEIQVFDSPIPAPGIFAQILFADIQRPVPDGGASATIGYQDGGLGNNDFQWSSNTAGSVMDGTVLSIVPEPSTGVFAGLVFSGLILVRRRNRSIDTNH